MSILPKSNFNLEVLNYLSSKILRNKKINFISHDTCIGSTINSGVYWEEWMLNYISKYYVNGTNMIDLGANIGTTTLLMSEIISPENKIYSFEPIYHDITYKNIIDNNLDDKINLFPCGVGNKISTFIYPKVNFNNNINFGATSIQNCESNKEPSSDEMIIPIEKIDNYNFKNISLIKIDVENMEILVLEGAINLISEYKPTIIIETYQYNELVSSDIFVKLQNLGYSLEEIPEGVNDFLLICK